jgi:hypothetical protein
MYQPVEDILIAPPDYKLYNDRAIFIGTFLGGPLAAGYLLAENYRHLGERSNARKTWLFTILGFLLIFGIAFLTPASGNSMGYLLPILYSYIASYLAKRLQGDLVKLHLQKMGVLYSNWRAVVVALIALAITIAFLIGLSLFVDLSHLFN